MRIIPQKLRQWVAVAVITTTLLYSSTPVVIAAVTVPAAAWNQSRVAQVDKVWNDFEWEVLKLTNKERMAQGILPLSTNSFLQTVARIRADELTVKASHIRPDGRSCFSVYQDFDALVPGIYGENVAAGQVTPEEVVAAWMASPGHRANILNDEYLHMGVGFLYRNDQSYEEYWTQLFTSTPEITSISVGMLNPNIAVRITDNIDDYNLVLIQYSYGEIVGYTPITSEMCSGYYSAKAGDNTVTVQYGELLTYFNVIPGFNHAGSIASPDFNHAGSIAK